MSDQQTTAANTSGQCVSESGDPFTYKPRYGYERPVLVRGGVNPFWPTLAAVVAGSSAMGVLAAWMS